VDDGNQIVDQRQGKTAVETYVKAVKRSLVVTSRRDTSITAGYICTVEFNFSSTAAARSPPQFDCSAPEVNVVLPVGAGNSGNNDSSNSSCQWRLSEPDEKGRDSREFCAVTGYANYRLQLVAIICFVLAGLVVLTTAVVVAARICSKRRRDKRRRHTGCVAPPTVAGTPLTISADVEYANVAAAFASDEGIYEKLIRSGGDRHGRSRLRTRAEDISRKNYNCTTERNGNFFAAAKKLMTYFLVLVPSTPASDPTCQPNTNFSNPKLPPVHSGLSPPPPLAANGTPLTRLPPVHSITTAQIVINCTLKYAIDARFAGPTWSGLGTNNECREVLAEDGRS
jgi:hypothetical protein